MAETNIEPEIMGALPVVVTDGYEPIDSVELMGKLSFFSPMAAADLMSVGHLIDVVNNVPAPLDAGLETSLPHLGPAMTVTWGVDVLLEKYVPQLSAAKRRVLAVGAAAITNFVGLEFGQEVYDAAKNSEGLSLKFLYGNNLPETARDTFVMSGGIAVALAYSGFKQWWHKRKLQTADVDI